jgi:hypothetical protein
MNHIHISVNGKTIVDETQNDSVSLFSTQKIIKKQKKNKNKKDNIVYYCGLFGDIHAMNKNSFFYQFMNFVWICIFITGIICVIPYIFIFLLFAFAFLTR